MKKHSSIIQKFVHSLVIFILLFSFLPANNSQAAEGLDTPGQRLLEDENAPTVYDCSTEQTQIPLEECNALVALYNSTSGDNWNDTTGWLQTSEPCSWYGVTCENEHVVELHLGINSLSGSIPSEIGNLTNLLVLEMNSNQLSGSIPSEIGNLTNLVVLEMRNNELSGSIPSGIGNLTHLQTLDLWMYEMYGYEEPVGGLSGTIPTWIGNLTNLTALNLGGNQLNGLIPPEIGNLVNLVSLNLNYNQLSGAIPHEITGLTSLQWLYLGHNCLYTSDADVIAFLGAKSPRWFATQTMQCSQPSDLAALLALYDNAGGLNWANQTGWHQNGDYCSWFGVVCTDGRVTALSLYGNHLVGSIPARLYYLSELQVMDLSYNTLIGHIPPSLGELEHLQTLNLSENGLRGGLPGELGNLTNLRTLDVSTNDLIRSLPTSLTGLNLDEFYFSDTNLCEPPDDTFQAWLAGIDNLRRTGVICSTSADITLSDNNVDEYLPGGTMVGTFINTNSDPGETHTYALASGTGDVNNGSFLIQGNVLKTNVVFNGAVKNTYSIRVRSTDSHNAFIEKPFIINITNDGKLKLTSMCAGRWRVRNPNSQAADFNWDEVNGAENGTGTVPANGEVYFLTVPGHKTVRLRLGLVQGIGDLQDIKATSPVPCGQNAGGDILEVLFSHSGGWVPHGPWMITISNGVVTDGSILFTQLMVSYAGPATNLKRLLHTIEINLQLNGAFVPTPAMPIQVCLTYNSDDLNQVGGDPNRFVIGTVPSDGTEWTMLSTTINTDTNQMCANVTHLSLFDIFINPLSIAGTEINKNSYGESQASVLPETGFQPDIVTLLPEQPQDKQYINLIGLASEETRTESFAESTSMQLEIPKIDLLRPIVGVPFEQGEWDLTWLYNQVGYLEGTAFPTWNGNTSLTAHVILPDGLLGPFAKLNTLHYGDPVIIHAWGKRYIYEVRTQEEVHPNDLGVFQHEYYAWLTMLTCSHYDEKLKTYRMRTVVRAVLVKIEDE